MKKVIATASALCLAISLGACGSSSKPKSSESSSEKTEQVEEKPKEETVEKKEEEAPKEEPAQQIVAEQTHYDVFRCDYREGVLGDTQVFTQNTTDFSQDYADLSPDGSFSFSIEGVSYTTKISLGDKDHHLYSGNESAEVTRILLDGQKTATVGSVDIEGYYVDNYILLEMVTQVNHKTTFATYYLSKHVDEQ